MGRPTPRHLPLGFVVAYWILLALTPVFAVSTLLVAFLWGPEGLTDRIAIVWHAEVADVIGSEEASRHAARASDRMVGTYQGLLLASTMPLVVLNVAWLLWGGLFLRRRRRGGS